MSTPVPDRIDEIKDSLYELAKDYRNMKADRDRAVLDSKRAWELLDEKQNPLYKKIERLESEVTELRALLIEANPERKPHVCPKCNDLRITKSTFDNCTLCKGSGVYLGTEKTQPPWLHYGLPDEIAKKYKVKCKEDCYAHSNYSRTFLNDIQCIFSSGCGCVWCKRINPMSNHRHYENLSRTEFVEKYERGELEE